MRSSSPPSRVCQCPTNQRDLQPNMGTSPEDVPTKITMFRLRCTVTVFAAVPVTRATGWFPRIEHSPLVVEAQLFLDLSARYKAPCPLLLASSSRHALYSSIYPPNRCRRLHTNQTPTSAIKFIDQTHDFIPCLPKNPGRCFSAPESAHIQGPQAEFVPRQRASDG